MSKQKKLKNKADTLWSKIIRFYGECEKCGKKGGNLHAAHIYSRRYAKTRHDLENGLCLCWPCHRRGHDRPVDFTHWVEDYLGEDTVQSIGKKAKSLAKPMDYEPVVKELKDIWKRMND